MRAIGAELLLSLAVLGGWALLTWGIASLTVWQVWPISAALLLLSLSGWQFLGKIAAKGLYALTRSSDRA